MVKFTQLEKTLKPKDIDEIEKTVSLKFPEEYRKHLLKYNGGQCSPNEFSFIENGKKTNSCVDWFLAIYDGEYDNLSDYIKTYKLDEKRLPADIIPIANDPGGNLICISCGKEDNGAIYFWDHEKEVDYSVSGDDDYSNLFLIANSFKDFLDRKVEDDYVVGENNTPITIQVGRKTDANWKLPCIVAYVESQTLNRFEIGSNTRDHHLLMVIDIYATNEGERLDLADWVTYIINDGFPYYKYY